MEVDTIESSMPYHTPVLFEEALEGLNIRPNGVYVDCTFGGGGHAKGILDRLGKDGKVFAFDQDADARKNLIEDQRLVFIPENFRYLTQFLRLKRVKKVDGVLADLGVSSHQFDTGARGFSTRFEGPFDMRMDQRLEADASSIIKNYSKEQLHKLFEQYGEVSNAKTLAQHIVDQRKLLPYSTIFLFKTLVSPVVKGNPNKYFAQVFQALRIAVNDEMGALNEMMQQLPALLNEGGRAAIITFHSLEDRIVKNFFNQKKGEEEEMNPFATGKEERIFKLITKKPIVATDEELKRNPRSRSAKLRVAEKVEGE